MVTIKLTENPIACNLYQTHIYDGGLADWGEGWGVLQEGNRRGVLQEGNGHR